MTNRMVRVSELIKRELGPIIGKEFDFGGSLVTVNAVNVTPDLRQGFVFIGVIGGKADKVAVVRVLNENSGLLWKRLTGRVTLKYTPKLSFRLDESVERGVRVLNVIGEVDQLPLADSEEEEEEEDVWEEGSGRGRRKGRRGGGDED